MAFFARLGVKDLGSYALVQRYDPVWAAKNLRNSCRVKVVPQIHVPIVFILHVFISLVDALAYIHHGLHRVNSEQEDELHEVDPNHIPIIHGDIKPQNILLRWPEGKPYCGLLIVLADSGCAEVASQSKGVCGTEGYDSPEVAAFLQLRKNDRARYERVKDSPVMSTKSDIYQLDLVMYILATYALWSIGEARERVRLPPGYDEFAQVKKELEEAMNCCSEVQPGRRPEARVLLVKAKVLKLRRDRLVERYGFMTK
ncbi:hypothetical protein LTS14_009617 [Recurvomyces mirabilis]|uniref:uncharacterized protein n=1 Tax=Recurvomyces mirabilis TaxID=574656 RepID=UPI002DE0DF50|nr:hypothetical protein LTS14_009617 [Recurvomyces mirabilis]